MKTISLFSLRSYLRTFGALLCLGYVLQYHGIASADDLQNTKTVDTEKNALSGTCFDSPKAFALCASSEEDVFFVTAQDPGLHATEVMALSVGVGLFLPVLSSTLWSKAVAARPLQLGLWITGAALTVGALTHRWYGLPLSGEVLLSQAAGEEETVDATSAASAAGEEELSASPDPQDPKLAPPLVAFQDQKDTAEENKQAAKAKKHLARQVHQLWKNPASALKLSVSLALHAFEAPEFGLLPILYSAHTPSPSLATTDTEEQTGPQTSLTSKAVPPPIDKIYTEQTASYSTSLKGVLEDLEIEDAMAAMMYNFAEIKDNFYENTTHEEREVVRQLLSTSIIIKSGPSPQSLDRGPINLNDEIQKSSLFTYVQALRPTYERLQELAERLQLTSEEKLKYVHMWQHGKIVDDLGPMAFVSINFSQKELGKLESNRKALLALAEALTIVAYNISRPDDALDSAKAIQGYAPKVRAFTDSLLQYVYPPHHDYDKVDTFLPLVPAHITGSTRTIYAAIFDHSYEYLVMMSDVVDALLSDENIHADKIHTYQTLIDQLRENKEGPFEEFKFSDKDFEGDEEGFEDFRDIDNNFQLLEKQENEDDEKDAE